jgi:hypothetical protein
LRGDSSATAINTDADFGLLCFSALSWRPRIARSLFESVLTLGENVEFIFLGQDFAAIQGSVNKS